MSFLGQSAVNSGTATPYSRIIEPSQLGLYLNLEQAELLRVRRYHEHWRFYVGQHWAFTREGGEPLVTLNYARALIDKSVAWLVGAGMTIKVPDALQHHTLPALEEVWRYNYRDQFLYNAATLGAVTGDVFVLVTYAEPTIQARRINPHTKGQIRIQLLNSEQVYPQWDPLNTDVLTSVRIETIYYDDRAQTMKDAYDNQARQLHTRRFSQIITRDQIIEQYQGQDPIVRENPLGEIPLVHIKNHPLPGEYYGLADMDSLLDLNRELNEKATDISDIVNYHSAPVTVITGAKVKQLERSPRNIWSGLPENAKVTNLELGSDLAASLNYFSVIKQALLEISGVPEGSLGKQQPISNTSGVALHTQYQPLVEKTNRKKSFYEPGLAEINYFVLRVLETVDSTFKLPTDLCKHCAGRIVEFVQPDGSHIKKCYQIDSQTFNFLDPDQVKVRHVRQHSFGSKIEESTFAQIKKEHQQHAPSFWDPEETKSTEQKAKELYDEQLEQAQSPEYLSATPPKPEPPTAPPTAIELPPEPELITLRRLIVDSATGEEKEVESKQIYVVPTGCKTCEYLNPYENTVILNDTVPKDKMIQANLYQLYLQMGIVSKSWVRNQITDIEDPNQVEQEIEDERAEAKESPTPIGGVNTKSDSLFKAGQGRGEDGNELERTQGPPFGTNLPGG